MQSRRKVLLSFKFALLSYGALGKVGWSILTFGSLFIWLFQVPQAMGEVIDFLGTTDQTTGTVVALHDTNATVNDQPVTKSIFSYKVNENEYTSYSYSTQSLAEGSSVAVEYRAAKPHIARVVGASRSLMGWGVLFLLVLPAAGIVLLYFAARNAITIWRLIGHGRLTEGRLKKVEPTNMIVNDEPVMRYIFEFQDGAGRAHTCSTSTHQGEDFTDNDKERIIFLETNPSVALPFDALPGDKKINLYGEPDIHYQLRLFDYIPLLFVAVNAMLFIVLFVL